MDILRQNCYNKEKRTKAVIIMLKQLLIDRPFIDGKYHKLDEPFNAFARMAHHGWDADPATGYDDDEMDLALAEFVPSLGEDSHRRIKAKAFAFVLDHMRIGVSEHDYFPLLWNWNRPLTPHTINKWRPMAEKNLSPENAEFRRVNMANGNINSWLDYDHSNPDWYFLYENGFPGILTRAAAYRKKHADAGTLDDETAALFDAIDIEYSAVIRFLCRLRDYAAAKDFHKARVMAASLDRLAKGAPVTLYDRLLLIYLYFMLSESVDHCQVRALGNGIDDTIMAPYAADLAAGRFTEDELDDFIGYFLMQWSAIGNYWGQPMYLGGTHPDGSTKVNAATMKILDIYDALGIYNPKIQVKYSKSAPDAYVTKLLDMIRRGNSSIVFCMEDNILEMFRRRGFAFEEYHDFVITGCYEYSLRAKSFGTGPCNTNIAGPIVQTMHAKEDYADFAEFEAKYFELLGDLFRNARLYVNEYEAPLVEINPMIMLTGTIESALEKGKDAFFDGGTYRGTTYTCNGLATAVDAVMAVKWLVFDEKLVSYPELVRILDENWSDAALRRKALNCPHKYGVGDPEADAFAAKLAKFVASFQGTSNNRGGVYHVEIHSARQYIDMGKRMPATADGRLAGEETSKNASPVMGMDKKGITALIRSALATEPMQFDVGHNLDVMLHESAVKGEEGMHALKSLLAAYEAGGGVSIHFNIMDAETLRDAQENPQNYKNLQIRVCGWNTLWNDMPKSEQDKYIERAEALAD